MCLHLMGQLCGLHLVELGVPRPLMLGSNPIEAWIVVPVGQLFWMTHLWFHPSLTTSVSSGLGR